MAELREAWRGALFAGAALVLGAWIAWRPLVWAGAWLQVGNVQFFAILAEVVIISALLWSSTSHGGWKWKALRVIAILGYAGSYVKLQHLAAIKLVGPPWTIDDAHPIAWAFWAPWIWPLCLDVAGLVAGAIAWEEATAKRDYRHPMGMAIACAVLALVGNAADPAVVPAFAVDALFPGSLIAAVHLIVTHARRGTAAGGPQGDCVPQATAGPQIAGHEALSDALEPDGDEVPVAVPASPPTQRRAEPAAGARPPKVSDAELVAALLAAVPRPATKSAAAALLAERGLLGSERRAWERFPAVWPQFEAALLDHATPKLTIGAAANGHRRPGA